MWFLCVTALVPCTIARKYHSNYHSQPELLSADANALSEDTYYDEYYGNYYGGILELYNDFDDNDYIHDLWHINAEWDYIDEIKLDNDELVTQKCVFWSNTESFCLCKSKRHRKIYGCKATDAFVKNAAKIAYDGNVYYKIVAHLLYILSCNLYIFVPLSDLYIIIHRIL